MNKRGKLIVEAMTDRLRENMKNNEGPNDAVGRKRTLKELGVKRIVDKMLSNYKNIALIHLIFPEAVILHTMRDPMDTLFSCYTNKFDDDNAMWAHDMTSLVTEYVIYLEIMQHFRNELPRGRIVDVSYESLIASPERVMREIVTSRHVLGLSWDPMVMRYTESNRTVHASYVRRSTYPSGGWRKYAKELEPLIRELSSHIPRLRAINAWPEIYSN